MTCVALTVITLIAGAAVAIAICAASRGDNCDLDLPNGGANTLKTEFAEDVCGEIVALANP
jgi:hypothetical protein